MKFFSQQKKEGFSLLELIVAMGVFSVAAVVVVGSFISLLGAQQRAVANQTAMDNIRFAVEAMAKEIRTGSNYERGCLDVSGNGDVYLTAGEDPEPCSAIKFINAKKEEVVYRWRNTASGPSVIDQAKGDPLLPVATCAAPDLGDQLSGSCDNATIFSAITDSKVRIDDFKVYVVGGASGDGLQPYVVINIEATVNPNNPRARTEIALQTAVSQLRLQP